MTDDIRAVLVSRDYRYSPTHKFLSDLSGFTLGTSGALQDKSALSGAADAADIAIVADAAKFLGGVALYRKGFGDPLLAFVTHAGLDFIPQIGQIVNIEWDNGPNRIFHI